MELEPVVALVDAVVEALVAAAQHEHVVLLGQPARTPVVEGLSGGSEQNLGHRPAVVPIEQVVDRREDRLGLDDHARSAAVGTIVDGPVFVVGVGAIVHQFDRETTPSPGNAHDALVEEGLEKPWEEGQDVDVHCTGFRVWWAEPPRVTISCQGLRAVGYGRRVHGLKPLGETG